MDLTRFPRRRYTEGYTPIEKLQRFSGALGGPEIYIKRDDLLGLTGGGNKTRKLEFVVADALAKGCDTLVTCGAVQSNHCRLTLSAAVKEGLHCRLVIEERVPGTYDPRASGNNFLFRLLGAETIKVMPGGIDEVAEMEKMAQEAEAEGRKPYIIDGSNASALSALGYVACAQELTAQLFGKGVTHRPHRLPQRKRRHPRGTPCRPLGNQYQYSRCGHQCEEIEGAPGRKDL